MTEAVPEPQQAFFASFLADPTARATRRFCGELLELEVGRAEYNLLRDPPLLEPSGLYRSDIARARHALDRAGEYPGLDEGLLDLRYNWLTLLGNRIATERGLHAEGVTSLSCIASARLNLPLTETDKWSEARLFRRYTESVLRDEWDYAGVEFRYPRSEWSPECASGAEGDA